MKTVLTSTAIAAFSMGAAMAGGYDHSGQFISDLFSDGNVLKFSFERVMPSFSGSDVGIFSGNYDNIVENQSLIGISLKADLNEFFSYAIIFDEPFSSDILYPDSRNRSLFGETFLNLDSRATTIVGRYRFDSGISFHGGLRYQSLEIDADLLGQGYNAQYSLRTERSSELGYLLGATYEKADIDLMVSLTYNSKVDYTLAASDTTNPVSSSLRPYPNGLETSTPDSWNLEFRKGLSDATSLVGSIRHTNWGDFYVPPRALIDIDTFGLNYDLAVLEDVTSYTIGIEHVFSERFYGSVAVKYEAGNGELVDVLAIANGPLGLSIGGSYAISENVRISGSLDYIKFDDISVYGANQFVTTTPKKADLSNNSALGIGFSIAYRF